jgi:hypothetical protein
VAIEQELTQMDKEHKQLRSTAKRWPRFWLWTGFAALSFQVRAIRRALPLVFESNVQSLVSTTRDVVVLQQAHADIALGCSTLASGVAVLVMHNHGKEPPGPFTTALLLLLPVLLICS